MDYQRVRGRTNPSVASGALVPTGSQNTIRDPPKFSRLVPLPLPLLLRSLRPLRLLGQGRRRRRSVVRRRGRRRPLSRLRVSRPPRTRGQGDAHGNVFLPALRSSHPVSSVQRGSLGRATPTGTLRRIFRLALSHAP